MTLARCYRCPKPATRIFAYAAEPWTPYCEAHPPQYGVAGDSSIPAERRDPLTPPTHVELVQLGWPRYNARDNKSNP